jgi:hypothetical protein
MIGSAPRGNFGGALLSGSDRRRSQRVVLRIPVTLKMVVAGKNVMANAATVSVNHHGAMLVCTRSFAADTTFELQNERTGQKMNCRVTRTPIENSDGFLIPVEFVTPSPSFWGISFPPPDWKPGEE